MSIAVGAETVADRPATASRLPEAFDTMRRSPGLQWLGRPLTYVLGALILTILGSGATLIAPRLLDPAAFGTFALLTSLFTYAGRADFGLSQLADKQIPGRADGEALKAGLDILNALWLVGFGLLAMTLPLVALFGDNTLPRLDTTLAIAGGIMAMIANGPVTLFRASSRLWEFTAVALILQLGMTIPRLAGLLAGGITGSFAALAAYYALCAFLFARPSPVRLRRLPLSRMARIALPLFAFNASWVLYLGANRWVSASLSSPHDLGLFSLSASLAMIGLGLMSTIAQTRYPRILARIEDGASTCSPDIERELFTVTAFLTAVAAAAVFTAGPAIAFLFPGYEGSVTSVVALAAACIPLGAMTWIVPMLIVRSTRPVADALFLMVTGLAALAVAMACGNAFAGIDGQAWGNAFAALLMFAAMAKLMQRLDMTTGRGSARIVAAQALAIAIAAALAFGHPAKADVGVSAQGLVNPPDWKTIFEDDFSKLDLQSASGGIWQPYYPWGGRSNGGNKELQYYIDPRQGGDAPDIQALEPYRLEDGVLAIRASWVPANLRGQSGGYAYASGLLNSAGRFHFQYGSVEIRAKIPHGRGLWPAFWLLPEDRTWPPELDVFEVLGHDTRTLHVTAHSGLGIPAREKSARTGSHIRTDDLSTDFHIYGLTWTKEKLVWSLDGRAVFDTATPADLHKPMFLVVNLAVGGDWPGAPDASTRFPATLLVDWIRVRQSPGDSNSVEKGAIQ